MISREKRFVECNTSILWITCQVFSTVSNCRKCVAFFLKDVEMREEKVPDPPRREELLAKEEIGGVSLCYCFYLFHVAEAHLNAIQTS